MLWSFNSMTAVVYWTIPPPINHAARSGNPLMSSFLETNNHTRNTQPRELRDQLVPVLQSCVLAP